MRGRLWFGVFSRIKKILRRTETRTRDRICFQTIRSVRDISRDDRARIPTCSLRTATDRFKANYSVDETTIALPTCTQPVAAIINALQNGEGCIKQSFY